MTQDTSNAAQQQSAESSAQKQAYVAPQLKVFGAVRDFTQGSGNPANDGGSGRRNAQSSPDYKTNSVRVGTHPMGFGLYLFDYKPEFAAIFGASGRQFGVMADEVARVVPQAVSTDKQGYTVVDYAMLGIERDGSLLH
jgi:hypothetical protein